MSNFNKQIDQDIRRMFNALPEETVHPSTKVELMERIENYKNRKQFESPFAKLAYGSAGVFAMVGIVLLISVIPTFNKSGDPSFQSDNIANTAVMEADSIATDTNFLSNDYYVTNYKTN